MLHIKELMPKLLAMGGCSLIPIDFYSASRSLVEEGITWYSAALLIYM